MEREERDTREIWRHVQAPYMSPQTKGRVGSGERCRLKIDITRIAQFDHGNGERLPGS